MATSGGGSGGEPVEGVLTPSSTEFDPVDEGQAFEQSVTYTLEVAPPPEDPPADPPTPGESFPVVIESVTSSVVDPSIVITIEENTVTIKGPYTNAFPGKTFKYIPVGQPGVFVTVPFIDIPSKIDALTTYNPATTPSTTVTYTVVTDAGIATITQTVNNNWDAGKALMLTALSRGAY